jgi:hypothetical protein
MIRWIPALLLITSVWLFQSCGKAVKDSSQSGRNPAVEPATPATVILVGSYNLNSTSDNAITSGVAGSSVFTFPTIGLATIPAKIFVQEGNAGNFKAKLKFKMSESIYNIECRYQGGASTQSPTAPADFDKGLSYNFIDCYDFLGRAMGMQSGEEVWLDPGNSIELIVDGADPRFGTITKSLVDVEWR